MIKRIIDRDPSNISNILLMVVYACLRRYRMDRRNRKRFLRLKVSEIPLKNGNFYILGSGTSIDSLSANHFREISNGFSVGLNLWTLHDFVPDAYSFERIGANKENKVMLIEKKLNLLADLEKDPKIFLKASILSENGETQIKIPQSLVRNIRIYDTIRIAGWSRRKVKNLLRHLLKPNVLKLLPEGLIYEKKASIERMTYLAMMSGFRNIIYVGVDLNDTGYFWDRRPELFKKFGLESLESGQNKSVHLTDVHDVNLPVSVLLSLVHDDVVKRGTVKLWVANSESKLANFLPIYEWASAE